MLNNNDNDNDDKNNNKSYNDCHDNKPYNHHKNAVYISLRTVTGSVDRIFISSSAKDLEANGAVPNSASKKKNWIMFTVGTVDVMSTEYRPSIGRYFVDAPRPNIGHMSAVYQSTVGDMSVNCRWHIGQLSVAYQSYVICIGKLLADTSVKYRSSIGQLSAKCRPSVGQVSARYR